MFLHKIVSYSLDDRKYGTKCEVVTPRGCCAAAKTDAGDMQNVHARVDKASSTNVQLQAVTSPKAHTPLCQVVAHNQVQVGQDTGFVLHVAGEVNHKGLACGG